MWGAQRSSVKTSTVHGLIQFRNSMGGAARATSLRPCDTDTLLNLTHKGDTLSSGAGLASFDMRFANNCYIAGVSGTARITAAQDTLQGRYISKSSYNTFTGYRLALSANAIATAFSMDDSSRNNTFSAETIMGDTTGTYSMGAYLVRQGTGLQSRGCENNVWTGNFYKLTGSLKANSHPLTNATLTQSVVYSRFSTALQLDCALVACAIKQNTLVSPTKAINHPYPYGEIGTLMESNIYFADSLSDSSATVATYGDVTEFDKNFNLFHIRAVNATNIKDKSKHAIMVHEPPTDNATYTIGRCGWVPGGEDSLAYYYKNCLANACGGLGIECDSYFGTPAFADTTFATFSADLSSGSEAERAHWPNGYSGAKAPVDTERPAPIADLSVLVTPGSPAKAYLTWTNVGDDSLTGRAYLIEVAHAVDVVPTAETFDSYITNVNITPALPGTTQFYLMPAEHYSSTGTNYYMLRVTDNRSNPNWSDAASP
jgi:hypothetical protein